METRFGIVALPAGRRRVHLATAFEGFVANTILHRVATCDTAAARAAAEIKAMRKRSGRPIEIRDTMIAGIALAPNATILTRNAAHFADLDLRIVNPWEPL
jgi:predicted nucleic acid-binding protein